jgi:uncharacterized protein YecT (DUF1311 family)
MIRSLILAVAVLAATPAANAASDCTNEASQADMNACAAALYAQSDAALNKTYKMIVARLKNDAPTAKMLLKAQKAWLAFRDAECSFQTSAAEGGSIQPMLQAYCLDDLTVKRTVALKSYLVCEEGDLSCPVPAAP